VDTFPPDYVALRECLSAKIEKLVLKQGFFEADYRPSIGMIIVTLPGAGILMKLNSFGHANGTVLFGQNFIDSVGVDVKIFFLLSVMLFVVTKLLISVFSVSMGLLLKNDKCYTLTWIKQM